MFSLINNKKKHRFLSLSLKSAPLIFMMLIVLTSFSRMPSDPNKGNPQPPSAQNKRLQQTQAQVDEVSFLFCIIFSNHSDNF
jgi:hypothetical protein